MEKRDYGNGIIFYANGLSDALCDTVWSFYYDNPGMSRPGVTISGQPLTPTGERWKNTIDQENGWGDPTVDGAIKRERARIDELVYQELRPVVSAYLDSFKFLSEAPNVTDTGYLWQRYVKGDGYYKEHVDGQQWVHSVFRRICGIIVYVNTVDEGGETFFSYHDLRIKPEKGGVVIFPAHWMYPHGSLVPLSSDKLILSSFLEFQPDFHTHAGHQ